ncbi:hypothetical protein [Ursidibacter sp. B-7004-1]
MKKLIISSIIVTFLSGCTMADIDKFMQPTDSAKMQNQQTTKKKSSTKKVSSAEHVIRIKKNPNEGKKQVSVAGMKMPSEFSYDEDGNLIFTPKVTNGAIRDYNRILERHGIRVEGY